MTLNNEKGFKIKNKRGGFPHLWCGICLTGIWFDLDNFFSVDIGKYFIRLFFRIDKLSFCRYLGGFDT